MNKMSNFKASACVICGDNYQEDVEMPWESSSDNLITSQLSVILLVRNILRISNQSVELLLTECGDPTSWGFKMCGPCRRVFMEAEFIHRRITQLSKEFQNLSSQLRIQLRKSKTVHDDNSTTKLFCKNVVRRGRKPSKRINNSGVSENFLRQVLIEDVRDSIVSSSSHGLKKIEIHGIKLQRHETQKNHETFQDFVKIGKTEPEGWQIEENALHTNMEDSLSNFSDVVMSETANDTKRNDQVENKSDCAEYCASGDEDNISELMTEKAISSRVNVFSIPQPMKRQKERDYQCPLCPRTALSKISCHGHILRAHYNDFLPFHCHLCEKQFKRAVGLRSHIDKQHGGVITPLDDADDQISNKIDRSVEPLSGGSRSTSDGTKLKCDLCPKRKWKSLYKSVETLEAHKKMVHKGVERPYECKKCGKTFKIGSVLRHHMYVHKRKEKEAKKKEKIREEAYCAECNRHFKSFVTLNAHFKTKAHSLQFPYLCEFCTKGFMQKSSLENHRSQEHFVELNIQPFECSFCKRKLSSKRALDHHIRLKHTLETKYKCEECNVGFMFLLLYNRHMSVVHEKEKPYLCTYCPKRFSSKSHLETHVRTHTGEKPYKCKFCGKEYSDKPTFNRHVEIHGENIHECSVCTKQFKVWHSYRLHMKSHNISASKESHTESKPIAQEIANTNEVLSQNTFDVKADMESVSINSELLLNMDG